MTGSERAAPRRSCCVALRRFDSARVRVAAVTGFLAIAALVPVAVPIAADATLRVDFASPAFCPLRMPPIPPDPYRYAIALYGQFPAVVNAPGGPKIEHDALRAARLIVTQPGRPPERVPYDPHLPARLPSFALAQYGAPARILQITYDTRRWCREPGTLHLSFTLEGETVTYDLAIRSPRR
jgi:hypothetical protein